MIICFGPFCIPIWHLGIVALLFLRPLFDLLTSLCGRRSTESQNIAAPAENTSTQGTERGTSSSYAEQDGEATQRRRGGEMYSSRGVVSVRSEGELEKLRAEAEAARVPLFLDFKATWCGPCRRIAPVFERLSRYYSGIFASVDVDECYNLRDMPPALPTFRVIKPGQGVVDTLTGASEENLAAMVARHASPLQNS